MASDSESFSGSSYLHLSFSSSSYDENDLDIDEEHPQDGEDVVPYQFEPLADENGEDQDPTAANQDEGIGLQWCTCGNCQILLIAGECNCCQEMVQVMHRMDELPESVACITNYPGFEPVCLNDHVLRVATFQYQQQYGAGANYDIHERYRYATYWQFVRWCFGVLGRHVRVPLPACAVQKIKKTFPAAQYVGFQYPNLDD